MPRPQWQRRCTTCWSTNCPRDGDGIASIDGPFVEGTAPGEYRYTPPFDFAAAVRFGELRPFAIASAATYRPPAPYQVTDAAYTADYDEVKAYGSIASAVRSAEQSEVARFWLENTDAGWLRIALLS